MEQRSFVDEEQKISTPSLQSVYNSSANKGPNDLLLESKQSADSSSRPVILCSLERNDSSAGNPSLTLEAKLPSVLDQRVTQMDPASNKSIAESSHIAHLASASQLSTEQTDLLDKPRIEIETILIDIVCKDSGDRLVSLLQKMVQFLKLNEVEKTQTYLELEAIHRLLQLACQLDSVACAGVLLEGESGLLSPVDAVDDGGQTALHYAASKLSTRCIDLLLRKRAKTDIRSKDGCIPLKSALQSKRWHNDLQTLSVIDVITILGNQDLTAVKLLADRTKDVLRLACHLAFDGDAVALTALLLATGKYLFGEEHKYESFLDLVVEKTLSRRWKDESADEVHRSSILKSLETIVHLKREFACSSSKLPFESQGKRPSSLLRAAQAGDETIIKILLNDTSNVNQTDSDGNTPLHWCLKTTKGLRTIWQLVTHGSMVGARNRLGLTPVHIAAGQGHLQTLQLLLAQDPGAIHLATVTKETPLFLAVKNNHVECAKLLLQYGSNSQVLNLRRQRPIDFASSQDMRMTLSDNGIRAAVKVQTVSDLTFFNSAQDRHHCQAECGPSNLTDGADLDVQIDRFIKSQEDLEDSENWLLSTQHAKTALCRYHMMAGGCARGDGCFYAHGEQELRPEAREKAKIVNVFDQKKIFVGGLLPAMGSDDLKNCFEAEFGPVQEAVVMNSQNGGHIQSRGFGFVTFKNEASCIAAVKQHYLTICGKRVEIKAAFQSSKRTDEEMLSIHLSNPSGLVKPYRETFNDVKWNNLTKAEASTEIKGGPAASNKTEITALNSSKKCSPPWLTVFKKWLPAFLSSVSRRQRGLEHYPLSSVKADFRATCGMELDHIALGFPKLSDFLRTMPELCRMKIVPVGRGPATHVVLQVCEQSLVSKPHQPSAATKILASSLVHEGRTYAAAAGYNIATLSENKSTGQSIDTEDSVPVKSQATICASSDLRANSVTHQFSVGTSSFKDGTAGKYNEEKQAVIDTKNLSLFSTFNLEELQQSQTERMPIVDSFKAWQHGIPGNNRVTRSLQHVLQTAMTNAQFQSLIPEAPATQPSPEQNTLSFADTNNSPYLEQPFPLSLIPQRDLTGFQRDAAPFYNPWNSDTFEGCRNLIQQMNLAATGEESPQSSLTSEDSSGSPKKLTEDSLQPCVICGDKADVWVAIPCAHKAICSPCKSQFNKRNMSLQRCFICQGRAREWIAHY